MDEKTATLLQGLADKLGTTSEYLWRVLIKQAPIDGFVTLVQYACVGVMLFAIIRLTRWALTKDWNNSDAVIPTTIGTIIGWIVVAYMVCSVIFSLPDFAAAFLNPEYWALNKVLHTVHR